MWEKCHQNQAFEKQWKNVHKDEIHEKIFLDKQIKGLDFMLVKT